MKNYTIGRDEGCDIVIHDDTDQISRRHAMLRIYPFGKIEIIPMGRNMTYLNGLPLRNDKVTRVHRGDVISLAKVKSLDWKMIPDPYSSYRKMAWVVLFVIIALIGCIIAFPHVDFGSNPQPVGNFESVGGTVDSYEAPASEDASDDNKKDANRFKFPETKPKKQVPKQEETQKPATPVESQPDKQIFN